LTLPTFVEGGFDGSDEPFERLAFSRPESSLMMSAERTNNSGAELAGCPSCAQPMRLISKDTTVWQLPDLYTFECRACGVLHTEERPYRRDSPLPRMNDSVTCPDRHLSDKA
jgi:hypothetical protein